MNSPRITYTQRPDTTAQGELHTLPTVYKFILDCHAKKKAAEPISEPDSSNDPAMVRNTEEVSHVEQRPDRPSETTPSCTRVRKKDSQDQEAQEPPRKGPINGRDTKD